MTPLERPEDQETEVVLTGLTIRSDELRLAAGRIAAIPPGLIASCQFPDVVADGAREIIKPREWA